MARASEPQPGRVGSAQEGWGRNPHKWTFFAAGADEHDVVAVCINCGLIRRSQLPSVTTERYIGLAGQCPDAPQIQRNEPEPRSD